MSGQSSAWDLLPGRCYRNLLNVLLRGYVHLTFYVLPCLVPWAVVVVAFLFGQIYIVYEELWQVLYLRETFTCCSCRPSITQPAWDGRTGQAINSHHCHQIRVTWGILMMDHHTWTRHDYSSMMSSSLLGTVTSQIPVTISVCVMDKHHKTIKCSSSFFASVVRLIN